MALNHWVGTGNITRDIEIRRTQAGKSVTTLTIAVERNYAGANGEKETDFVDCILWERLAEFAGRNLSKGRRITVEGSLQSRKWTDRNGQSRVAWEIRASNVYFADSRQSTTPSQTNATEAQETGDTGFAEIEDDGDLPF